VVECGWGCVGFGVWRLFFFFEAEDGIRDWSVTGVQTCALPIWPGPALLRPGRVHRAASLAVPEDAVAAGPLDQAVAVPDAADVAAGELLDREPEVLGEPDDLRSEERRVGEEGGSLGGQWREVCR